MPTGQIKKPEAMPGIVRRGRLSACLVLTGLLCLAVFFGCSENTFTGTYKENEAPTIRLTDGPVEGDMTQYRVRFHWFGHDTDGRVEYYEFVLVDGNPFGFDPADTTGKDKWTKTFRTESTFVVTADDYDTDVTINNNLYERYAKTHTFFIKAVDDRGKHSQVAYRSFTAWTLAPYVFIRAPVNPHPGGSQTLNPVTLFSWIGRDPIDSPWNTQDVDSIRYIWDYYQGGTLEDLNKHPEKYERKWTPWISYEAQGDSGRSTILGDDEALKHGSFYFFAIQAMDEAGAVTSIFDPMTNFRSFLVIRPTGPLLTIRETHVGTYRFLGTNMPAEIAYMPAGFPLDFRWEADASHYGCEVATYRYGWDVADLNDPGEWDVTPGPFNTSAPTKRFYSGIHTLFVETADIFGIKTLGQIEVNIVSVTMDRNLLWVDDFYSTNFNQTLYAFPTELQHDNFWTDICSRAEGFDPSRDVYDTAEHNFVPPDLTLLWRYKNIIWTHTSDENISCWYKLIYFVPETFAGSIVKNRINYLSIFLQQGGHLWTLGKSDRDGGLAGVIMRTYRYFPIYLKCEIMGPQQGCSGDTSGVYTMAYMDYCVSVLDKIGFPLRPDPALPDRDVALDAMAYAYKDDSDPATIAHPGLPDTLVLWNEVTRPGRFFDPRVRGFNYVEVYNPAYWMRIRHIRSRSCFHPIFRMRTRSTRSCMDGDVVAFWVTNYEDIAPSAPGAVAAPSVHFGFPLWFFNREQAEAITDVIFEEWHIKSNE